MRTDDFTLAMSSAMDISSFTKWCVLRANLMQRLGAPRLDVPYGPEYVAWIFAYDLQAASAETAVVDAMLNKVDPHERWTPDTLAESLADTCGLIGLPPDANRHQQPTDLRLCFGVPIYGASLFEYMNDEFDIDRPLECLTPELFVLYTRWLRRKALECQRLGIPKSERVEWIAPELKLVGMRLLAFTCPEGLTGRLKALFDACDYLKFTSGCHDLVRGHLTDEGREIAALREFDAKGWPA